MRQAPFGKYLRRIREARQRSDTSFSVRGFAQKVGVAACYISKVERGDVGPPSEATIRRMADVLGEDRDVMLALAGKISSDLREAIVRKPRLFAMLIRQLKDAPDEQIERVVREAGAEFSTGEDAT